MNLLILGTGGFAMDVADLVVDIPNLSLVGFVQSTLPYTPGDTLMDLPIYWVDELATFTDDFSVICALGTTFRYQFIERVEALGIPFATIIHPSSRISSRAHIGQGTIINTGVNIATHTVIGKHVIINRGATIGHHNNIHDFATISPGANLAGNVTVGDRAWIGLGANVIERRSIGRQSIVGAGALVTKDVPERTKVMGVPARVIEENIDGL